MTTCATGSPTQQLTGASWFLKLRRPLSDTFGSLQAVIEKHLPNLQSAFKTLLAARSQSQDYDRISLSSHTRCFKALPDRPPLETFCDA